MEIYDSFGLDMTLIIYLGAELRYHLLVCVHNDREKNIETISADQSFQIPVTFKLFLEDLRWGISNHVKIFVPPTS